jgi:predicted ABC-type ATPase
MQSAPKQKAATEPQPPPGIAVGDELYFRHESGPRAGRVVAHGKHGCTLEHDGSPCKVKWEHVLGHKKRAAQHYTVVDQGEDGMIVEDANGKRRFIGVPDDAREERLVAKAFGDDEQVMLFLKSDGSMKNRPGLSQKKITDKTGRQQTKWVRTNKDEGAKRQGAAPDGEAGAAQGYGTHNLQAGDKVSFEAGDFKGSGKIVGTPGKDGAHVKDASGRVHAVRWSEITGHDKNGAEKPKVESKVRGEQKPIPAEKFKAADYAKQHDDENVTPDAILSHFPADTKDKIAQVQERLKSVEQTIDQHRQGDGYSEKRARLHREIYDHFLSEQRVDAATPPDGEKPTFTILGGRGGSGKSWFKGKAYDPDKSIVLDADEIKGMLPEYEGWNAAQVHEESSDILKNLLNACRQLGVNVVLDGTLNTSKSAIDKVKAFKDSGYRIEAHYMHLPRQEAAKRAVSRFLGKTNRYVPVDVVLSNRHNEANFDEVRKHADKWSFRDNNVPEGHEPKLISQSENGSSDKSQAKKEGEPLTKSEAPLILVLWRKQ